MNSVDDILAVLAGEESLKTELGISLDPASAVLLAGAILVVGLALILFYKNI